jgi:cytoskeletal protein CcmA (bactofilin family)
MWGKRNATRSKRRRGVGAFLDDASEIEGKYTCAGTVMLDAKFRGEITAKDSLIIGERAIIEAAVQAAVIVIYGKVIGDVTALERAELKSTARVTGDVQAPVVVMEAGAVHDGHCRMTFEETRDTPVSAVVVPLKG